MGPRAIWLPAVLLLTLPAPAVGQPGVPSPVGVHFEWLPSMLTVHDDRLYFRASGPSMGGWALWMYDAATGQAEEVLPLDPLDFEQAANMAVYDERLFFGSSPDGGWSDLYAYDADLGAHVGYPLDTLATAIRGLTVFDGLLYFVAALANGGGTQLWAFDVVTEQGAPVTTLWPGLRDGQSDRPLVAYAGRLYFSADDGAHGSELWAFDPALGAAALVADIRSGPASSSPRFLIVYDGRLFFAGTTATGDSDLWVYDASTNEASMAADLGSPGGSPPAHLIVYDDRLFFSAGPTETGPELWAYDATTGVAGLVTEIGPGDIFGAPQEFAVYNNVLYFNANDGVHGQVLWSYDAAADSARLVADLQLPVDPVVYDGRMYFGAIGEAPGLYLWSLETPTAAMEEPHRGGALLELRPVLPNPAASSATLALTVSSSQRVRVEVFDLLGRSVAVLYEGPVAAGLAHLLHLDASSLRDGVYIVRATGTAAVSARAVTVRH